MNSASERAAMLYVRPFIRYSVPGSAMFADVFGL
jgi:hypothetical protein